MSTQGFSSVAKIARGSSNCLDQFDVFVVVIPLDEIFVDSVDNDEATLESTDGEYKLTLRVAEAGKKVDDQRIRLTFPGVVPGKKYTLTYDTKLDATGAEVISLEIFSSRLITTRDLENAVREEYPFHNKEDDAAFDPGE
jgi:hypothetical protein